MPVLVAALAAVAPALPQTPAALGSLPAGDAIVTVDMTALLTKALPAALANKPESRQKLDENIARIREDYGIDLREVRSVTVSASPYGVDPSWVALLDGKFDNLVKADGLARAAEQYAKKYPAYGVKTETHEGATIYLLAKTGASPRDTTAIAVVDAQTALFGSVAGVRGALGARKGSAPNATANAQLVEAYRQSNATAVVRFATVLPKELSAEAGSDPFMKSLAAIKFIFGSAAVGSDNGLALDTTARTGSADEARSVHATLTAVVGLGRTMAANKPELAALIDYVTVGTAGNDVRISVALPPDKLDPLFKTVAKQ